MGDSFNLDFIVISVEDILKNLFLMFIYFWDTEKERMSGGGAEREGDTQSEASFRLWAVSTEPNMGLELTNCEIRTWPEVGCLTDWATQASLLHIFFDKC